MDSFKRFAADFGLPRIIIIVFLLALFLAAPVVGVSVPGALSDILIRVGQACDGAARRDQIAGLPGIGEEGHRRGRPDQHQRFDGAQLVLGRLGDVAQAFDGRQAGARLQPGREGLDEQARAGSRGDPARSSQACLAERSPAE